MVLAFDFIADQLTNLRIKVSVLLAFKQVASQHFLAQPWTGHQLFIPKLASVFPRWILTHLSPKSQYDVYERWVSSALRLSGQRMPGDRVGERTLGRSLSQEHRRLISLTEACWYTESKNWTHWILSLTFQSETSINEPVQSCAQLCWGFSIRKHNKNDYFFSLHVHLLHLSIDPLQASSSLRCPQSHLYGAKSPQSNETIWPTIIKEACFQGPRTSQGKETWPMPRGCLQHTRDIWSAELNMSENTKYGATISMRQITVV